MDNILRGVFGYLFLIAVVRVVGKRLGTQITPFDTVIIFFLGGTMLTPVLGDERSIASAIATAAGISLAYVLVGWLKLAPNWARFFDGTPMMLLTTHEWEHEVLTKLRLNENDVMAAARATGLSTLDQIHYAILERNGQISVISLKDSSINEA
jgi:uncharacterized membrane protein YcaP (DUF421 family)